MLLELLMSFSNYVCSYRVLITLEEIRTEQPTLYLIFPVIVSTMTMSMSMTGKSRYIAPPKVVNFPI